jgi:hypothetical protein
MHLKDKFYAVHKDDQDCVYTITKKKEDQYVVSWGAHGRYESGQMKYSKEEIIRNITKYWIETNEKGEKLPMKFTTAEMIAVIKEGEVYEITWHDTRTDTHNGSQVSMVRNNTANNSDLVELVWKKERSGIKEGSLFPINSYTLQYSWKLVPAKRKANDFWEAFNAYENGKKIENQNGDTFTKGSSLVYFSERNIRGEWYIYE